MGILYFRPFKKMRNDELLILIDEVMEGLQHCADSNEIEIFNYNQLIKEIKIRKLSLNPAQLYSKILYSSHQD